MSDKLLHLLLKKHDRYKFSKANMSRTVTDIFPIDQNKLFKCEKVEHLMHDIIDSNVNESFVYNQEDCPKLCLNLTEEIRKSVKELNFERYKVICIVQIFEKKAQGISSISRLLCDTERDRFVVPREMENVDMKIVEIDQIDFDDYESVSDETNDDEIHDDFDEVIVPVSIATNDVRLAVDKFFEEHADCPRKCCCVFKKNEVADLLRESKTLDYYSDGYNRLNLAILAQLRVLLQKRFSESRSRNLKGNKIHEKIRCKFMIEGEAVCKKFYLFVHNIGERRWRNLLQTYTEDGLVEKRHGLCSKKPTNATPIEQSEFVIEFLRNYAEEHALVLPRQKNSNNSVKVLPHGESKKFIHQKYIQACQSKGNSYMNHEPVSLFVFKKIWISSCSEIVLLHPRINLCGDCERNSVSNDHSHNLRSSKS